MQTNYGGTLSDALKTLITTVFPNINVILSNPNQVPKKPDGTDDKPVLPHAYLYTEGIHTSSGGRTSPNPVKSVTDVYVFSILIREEVTAGQDIEARKHAMVKAFREAFTVSPRFSIGIYPTIEDTDYRQRQFDPAQGFHEVLMEVSITVPQRL